MKKATVSNKMLEPTISVIVPVYNAEKAIAKCIHSLLNLIYPSDGYEIIVVDNNCTDNSIKIVKDMSKNFVIKIIKCLKKGSYVARNLGAKHAKGEILAFTDSDCEVACNWLQTIEKRFKNRNIVALQGPGNISKQNSLMTKAECINRPMTYSRFWGDTKNFAIQKRVFDAVGGFKEFDTGSDALLLQYLRTKGYEVEFNTGMIVYHTFPTSLKKLIWKNWKHGRGDFFIQNKLNSINRKKRIKMLLLRNFQYSYNIIAKQMNVFKKCSMILYLFLIVTVRCMSYIIHSFLKTPQ